MPSPPRSVYAPVAVPPTLRSLPPPVSLRATSPRRLDAVPTPARSPPAKSPRWRSVVSPAPEAASPEPVAARRVTLSVSSTTQTDAAHFSEEDGMMSEIRTLRDQLRRQSETSDGRVERESGLVAALKGDRDRLAMQLEETRADLTADAGRRAASAEARADAAERQISDAANTLRETTERCHNETLRLMEAVEAERVGRDTAVRDAAVLEQEARSLRLQTQQSLSDVEHKGKQLEEALRRASSAETLAVRRRGLLEMKEEELIHLRAAVCTVEQDKRAAERRAAKAEAEAAALESRSGEELRLRRQRAAADADAETLRRRNAELLEELAALREAAERTGRGQMDEMRGRLRALQCGLETAQTEVAAARDRAERAERVRCAAEAEALQSATEAADARQVAATARGDAGDAQERRRAAEQREEELRSQFDQLQARSAETEDRLRTALAGAETEAADALRSKEQVQEELGKEQVCKVELQEQLAATRRERDQALDACASEAELGRRLRSDMEKLRVGVEGDRQQLVDTGEIMRRLRDELSKELARGRERERECGEEVLQCRAAVTDAEARRDTAEMVLKRRDGEVDDLKERLQSVAEELEQQRRQREQAETERDASAARVSETESELVALREQHEVQQHLQTELLGRLRELMEAGVAQNRELEEEVSVLRRDHVLSEAFPRMIEGMSAENARLLRVESALGREKDRAEGLSRQLDDALRRLNGPKDEAAPPVERTLTGISTKPSLVPPKTPALPAHHDTRYMSGFDARFMSGGSALRGLTVRNVTAGGLATVVRTPRSHQGDAFQSSM